jgi:hypothetical protein
MPTPLANGNELTPRATNIARAQFGSHVGGRQKSAPKIPATKVTSP